MCRKDYIERKDCSAYADIEDIDRLHTLIMKILEKYKDAEFDSIQSGFDVVKKELLGEFKFSKMTKRRTIFFYKLDN